MREWEKQAKHCVFCCKPRLQLWFMLLTQQQNPIRTTPGTPLYSHHIPTWWGCCCMIIALVRHGIGMQSPFQTPFSTILARIRLVLYMWLRLYAQHLLCSQHAHSIDPATPILSLHTTQWKATPGIEPDHHPMLGRYNPTPYRSTLCGLSLYGSTPRLYYTHVT